MRIMKLNLKKIYIFPIVAACGILTSSCNDFLDREPISSITPAQYFNSAEELGAYAIRDGSVQIFQNKTGYFIAGGTFAEFHQFFCFIFRYSCNDGEVTIGAQTVEISSSSQEINFTYIMVDIFRCTGDNTSFLLRQYLFKEVIHSTDQTKIRATRRRNQPTICCKIACVGFTPQ